ncbi:hypothetical protein AS9A_0081 [Hoyosella subflava DQS3-9A1]|uniref:Uncharacterized protein n=1 Tax=Hoyosella subflava (strain DSM 45089 / JCM 17490 / NBRC 109087 / DQS3-9A1) TaxID=443218 RepID=F6ERM1_HOYSD|nr:hypothetical protein AS9A_0081 [Hoyosella subflava DQS3-9A1]
MTEVASGGDYVADALLENSDLGEPTVSLAVPDVALPHIDAERTAGPGAQCDFTHIAVERGEQLLRHPGGAQQPSAAYAIGDDDATATVVTDVGERFGHVLSISQRHASASVG